MIMSSFSEARLGALVFRYDKDEGHKARIPDWILISQVKYLRHQIKIFCFTRSSYLEKVFPFVVAN